MALGRSRSGGFAGGGGHGPRQIWRSGGFAGGGRPWPTMDLSGAAPPSPVALWTLPPLDVPRGAAPPSLAPPPPQVDCAARLQSKVASKVLFRSARFLSCLLELGSVREKKIVYVRQRQTQAWFPNETGKGGDESYDFFKAQMTQKKFVVAVQSISHLYLVVCAAIKVKASVIISFTYSEQAAMYIYTNEYACTGLQDIWLNTLSFGFVPGKEGLVQEHVPS